MKRTRNTFFALATRMIGFGVLIGLIFPFFVNLFGVPKSIAFSGPFIASCVTAGILVGLVNIVITHVTVKKKLTQLTKTMDQVKDSIISVSESGKIGDCNPEHCSIPVETQDEFGQSAQAFNELITAFSNSLRMLDDIKTYTAIFSGQLDLHALAQYALERMMRATDANAGAILFAHEGEIALLHEFGIRDAASLCQEVHIARAFVKGESCLIVHPADVIVESTLTQFHPKEVIVEPVLFQNVPLAVIVLARAEAFESGYNKQISIFTQSLAVALHNALEHEQLQKLAALDPLTGLLNRRFGLVRLAEEYSRAVRRNAPLGVLMIDIDHFKQVNDTYGHMAGDRVLKNITAQIRSAMREGDIALRYGGEEFLVILPGASKDDVFIIAERIRHAVREQKTGYGDQQIGATVSIGVDAMPESGVGSELELIGNADEALYRAKRAGRDRVLMHGVSLIE